MSNYSKAYKEVIEILKYVPKESVNKIPEKMINTFAENMDENYNFSIDLNKNFEEQELLNETKAILANIFRDYWATPYQKEKILEKERYDRQQIENEKKLKYSSDIFNIEKKEKLVKENENILPIELKQENFLEKIINFFKQLFHLTA